MRISIGNENRFSKFICLALIYLFVINMSNGLAQLTGVSVSTISTAFKALIGVYFLSLLPVLLRHFSKNMLIVVGTSVIVSLLNCIFFPSLQVYFTSTMVNFFTMCLPITLTAMAIDNIDYFKTCLLTTARIMAVMSLILLYGIFSHRVNFYTDSYSMGFGYAMLTPILILFYQLITEKKKNLLNAVCLGALLIILISYGSRGPLLAILLFVMFYLIRFFIEKKRYTMIALVVIGSIVAGVAYEILLRFIGNALIGAGINSRTIYMLTSGSLTQTQRLAGRNNIWDVLIPEIYSNPFAIRGINAEWSHIGYYAHNIIVELIYQLGIIVGGAIIVWIGHTIAKQLFNKNYSIGNEICIILMFSTIPGLMFSNSLWVSSSFWIWIGISAGIWRKHNSEEQSEVLDESSVC